MTLVSFCQIAASVASVALMGGCGVQLLRRFVRVLKGDERADGLPAHASRRVPWRGMAAAAGAALLSRVLVYLIAYGMHALLTPDSDGFFATLDDLWRRWDTRHYIGIAQEGYTAVGDERLRLVFFPLFPLLMRAASLLTGGSAFHGGLIVSLICTCVSAAFLYDLGNMHGGRKTGALCVAYFLLSPMSVFLNCAYTEALFICLTLGAAVMHRRGRPWLCAVLGAASALTRMPGVIVAGLPIIALLALIPKRRLTAKAGVSCALQVLLVFSGLFAYWAVNDVVTGDPFTYMVYQKENWFQEVGSFWQTTSTTVLYVFEFFGEDDWFFCWVTQLFALFGIYALLCFRSKRLPFDLAAYSFVYVAVVLAPTWLLSGPRYLYALIALPLLKARLTDRDGVHGAMLLASLMLLVLYIYGFTVAGRVL